MRTEEIFFISPAFAGMPVGMKLNDGVAVQRDFSDYKVVVDDAGLPTGVELIRKVG